MKNILVLFTGLILLCISVYAQEVVDSTDQLPRNNQQNFYQLSDDEIRQRSDSLRRQIQVEQGVLENLHDEIDEMRMAMVSPPFIQAADQLYLKGAIGWAKFTYLNVYEYFATPDSLKERALYMYLVIGYQQGRFNECINRGNQFIYEYPLSEFIDNVNMVLALSHFSLAQFQSCRDMASKVSPNSPQFAFSLYLNAVSYYQENMNEQGVEKAREELNNMLFGPYANLIPEHWKGKVYITLAQLLYEQEKYTEAYEYYNLAKAKGADPDVVDLGIVWLYLRVGLVDEGLDLLDHLRFRHTIEEDLRTDIELARAAAYLQKGEYDKTFAIYNNILEDYGYIVDIRDIEIGQSREPISGMISEDLQVTQELLDTIREMTLKARLEGRYEVADSLEKIGEGIQLQQDALRSIGLQAYRKGSLDLALLRGSILVNLNDERARVEDMLVEINYLQRRLPPSQADLLDNIKNELTSLSLILADIENEVGAEENLSTITDWLMQAEYGAGISHFMRYKDIERRLSEVRLRQAEIRYELQAQQDSLQNINGPELQEQ
ncbi:MAG: hypothetical protein APR63_01230 [Desulfuromonas sp. SDB]|nr:MAG: hypothetical protein APR63_01230 [Desulfuromonas sp. SDB]